MIWITQIDLDHNRHARANQARQRIILINHQLDRNTLHDLGKVAGRIVRRQQAELRARGREQALQCAGYRLIGKGIEHQFGFQPFVHAADLGFLEVGLDPQLGVGHYCQQVAARGYVLTDTHVALADTPGNRGADLGTLQVQLCLLYRRFGYLNLRVQTGDIGSQGIFGQLLRLAICLRLADLRAGHFQLCTVVAELFFGGVAGLAQWGDASDVEFDAALLSCTGVNIRGGGGDETVLLDQA